MAYMRGDHYIWDDGNWLHIWCRDGYDAWDEALWACDDNEKRREGFKEASGTSLPMDIMDEYVVMRMAELIEEGLACATVDRVVDTGGNFGSAVAIANAETLKSAFAELQPRMIDHTTAVHWQTYGKPENT